MSDTSAAPLRLEVHNAVTDPPASGRMVIVAGGPAWLDGAGWWHSGSSSRQIEWPVEWWAPFPSETSRLALLEGTEGKHIAGEGGFGPGKSSGYHGPIEVGDEFIWEPGLGHAFEHIVVTEIEDRDGEQWICSTNKRVGRAWNDESRFREAVVRPASPGGSAPRAPQCDRGHPISDWMDAYCPTCIRLGLEDVPPQFTGELREQIIKRCGVDSEPPPDHEGFVEARAAGLAGVRQSIEARRKDGASAPHPNDERALAYPHFKRVGEPEPLDPLVAYADDPFGDTVHHPYSAFNQGFDAAEAGHSSSLNPYAKETREQRQWASGHAEWRSQYGHKVQRKAEYDRADRASAADPSPQTAPPRNVAVTEPETAHIVKELREFSRWLREGDSNHLTRDWETVDAAASRLEAQASRIERLEGALRRHHVWQQQPGVLLHCGIGEDGEPITLDNATEYADSSMYEQTEDALADSPHQGSRPA